MSSKEEFQQKIDALRSGLKDGAVTKQQTASTVTTSKSSSGNGKKAFQQKIDELRGKVKDPNWKSGGYKQKADEAEEQAEQARKKAWNASSTVGNTGVETLGASLAALFDKDAVGYDADYETYMRQYYQQENEEKRTALSQDSAAAAQYSSGRAAQSDAETLKNAFATFAPSMYADKDFAAYMGQLQQNDLDYLEQKYGTRNYRELKQLIDAQVSESSAALEAAGYRFDRMSDYETRQEESAKREKEQQANQQFANEHGVLSSAATVPLGMLQGLDYLGVAAQTFQNELRGEEDWRPVDSNKMGFTNYVTDIRGQVGQNIEDSTKLTLGGQNVARFLYDTGMSMADSSATIALAGPMASVLLGANAASTTAKQVLDNGGSAAQATLSGLAAGAAEMVFEKYSIENLLESKNVTSVKRLVTETLKQGGVEASEEMATEIANILSNALIMGQDSDFNQSVEAYKAQGMTEEEARKQAIMDCIAQVAWAGAGGFVSGGVMGGGTNALNLAGNSYIAQQAYGQTPETLINQTLAADEQNKLAKKLQQRSTDGKRISGLQLSTLNEQRMTALEKQEKAQTKQGETAVTIESASQKYGKQAGAMKANYKSGQDVEAYDKAFKAAWEMGRDGFEFNYAMNDSRTQYLDEKQRELAYQIGRESDGAVASPEAVSEYETSAEGKTIQKSTDKVVELGEVVRVDGGTMTFALSDGSEAASDDLSFGSEDEAVVYQAVNRVANTAEDANALIQGYASAGVSAKTYSAGINFAYNYGRNNLPMSELNDVRQVMALPAEVRERAYEAGKALKQHQTEARQRKYDQQRQSGKRKHKAGRVLMAGQAAKNTAEDGGVKYSLRSFSDGRRFVDVQTDQHLFDGASIDEANALAKEIIRKRFAGKVIGKDNKAFVNMQTAKEYIHPVKNIEPDIRNAKMRAAAELDNLIDAGTNFRTAPDGRDGHVHPDVTTGFDYFDSIFKVGEEYYSGVINIKNIKQGKLLKDVTKIKNITQDIISSYGVNPKSEFLRDASIDIISEDRQISNKKFSTRTNGAQEVQGFRTWQKQNNIELTEVQEAGIFGMERLTALMGIDMYVYQSYVKNGERVYIDENGKEAPAPNGCYVNGKVYIDLNAGTGGKGTMLYTVSHEVTHFIQEWSPAKYEILCDIVAAGYEAEGIRIADLIEEQRVKAMKNGIELSFDEAYEEVIADSMEAMLTDGRVVELMAEIRQQDKSLWEKLCDFFQNLLDDLKGMVAAYSGYAPNSKEGRMVQQMQDVVDKIQPIFAEALLDAGDTAQAATKNTAEDGGVKYSLRYLAADTNLEILNMVNRVANGDFKANEKVYFGDVTDAVAEQINKLTGIRVNGFKVAIEARQIEHIMKGHGVNGNTDHSMADPNDIAKMEYALTHPDDIRKAGKTQAYTYMRNGRNRTADTVLYEKKIGSKSYYVVQAVPDTKAKTLYVVTAFIGDGGYKKEAPQLINAKSPDATAETGSASTSEINVAQNTNEVKRQFSFRAPAAYEGISRAERMEQEGQDSESIRKETGLFRSYDGRWRMEMDDSRMELAEEITDGMTLGDLVDHWELFDAYPALRHMKVRFSQQRPGVSGYYSRYYRMIYLDERLMNDREELKSTLLHEIQHAIQHQEGFAGGANTAFWQDQLDNGYDSRRREAIEQEQQYRAEYDRLQTEDPAYFNDMMELERMTPNVPRGKIDFRTLERIEEDPVEWQQYDAQREALEERYGEERVFDFIDLMYQIRRSETLDMRDARTLYYETAGEIEARDVEARRNLTREQRQNKRPNVDYKDAVFAEGAKYSLRGIEIPTRTELEQKPDMTVVDISAPQTKGTFAQRRQQIMDNIDSVIAEPYLNRDTNTYIFLTKKSYTHAFSNPSDWKINAAEHLPELIESAILTHGEAPTHGDVFADGVYTFFAAANTGKVQPVKLKVKEYKSVGQNIPDNIRAYFRDNPDVYAASYDTVVLEVEEIEESPSGSAIDMNQEDSFHSPNELSTISVADLLGLVKGDAARYVPKHEQKNAGKYSLRSKSAERTAEDLERQNELMQGELDRLRELVKLQKKTTRGRLVTHESVGRVAKQLIRNNNAKGDYRELTTLLEDVYGYIAGSDELTWGEVTQRAQPAIDWLMKHQKQGDLDPYAQEILDVLKGNTVRLSDNQKREAAYLSGGWGKYRNSVIGAVGISDQATTTLDQFWADLAESYPQTFDKDIPDTDQPGALLDAIESLRNMHYDSFGYGEAALREALLQEVYDGYWQTATLHTVADKYQKELDELKSDYKKSRKAAVEKRKTTAQRHKVQWVVKELNDLLLKGTKERHVPEELQKAVAEALSLVNMDTVGANERVAKYDALIAEITDPVMIEELTATRDRIAKQGDKMKAKLEALQLAYDKIEGSSDPALSVTFDENISGAIKNLVREVGDTPLRDMTREQLESVYDVYKMILTSIRGANKAFKENRTQNIQELRNSVMGELGQQKRRKKERPKQLGKLDSFFWNNQKPLYAFLRMGSSTLSGLYENIRNGEDVWARDMGEAKAIYQKLAGEFGQWNWDMAQRYDFQLEDGRTIQVSLDQIMSLYAYSKRPQAAAHIKEGGIVLDAEDIKKKVLGGIELTYEVNDATAYAISDQVLENMLSKLTQEQKAFADKMQDYLTRDMGSKGNEVSMQLYGIRLFKEEHYFPLHSSDVYTAKIREQQQNTVKIKNSGFTKTTVEHANSAIVLTGFLETWAEHVNEMSMYHAFTLPMEDFYRVYNYSTQGEHGKEGVRAELINAHGQAAANYVDQLLQDLNGGARSDPRENTAKAFVGKFKKAAVLASGSVVIQQPSAIVRACAEIDAKYFNPLEMLPHPGHKDRWQEVKQYAPVAVIKEMGHFDTDMGLSSKDYLLGEEYEGLKEKTLGFIKDGDYRDELFGKGAAFADESTWCAIWAAVKREQAAANPQMSIDSDGFLELCGKRFTEVITKTQVYDSVMSRSANMRSKGLFMNMATAFMAEPTTSINMLEQAVRECFSPDGDKKKAARVAAAVYASMLLNSVLVSFVYAARDDDEEKTFWEKYFSNVCTELVEGLNPLTYYPFIKDIWSVLQGYDVERADMSLISDVVTAMMQAVKVYSEDTSDMDDEEAEAHWKKVSDVSWTLADYTAAMLGLPLRNVRRDGLAAWNLFKSIASGNESRESNLEMKLDMAWDAVKDSLPILGWMDGDTKADKLYEATVKGNTAYVKRLNASYATESALNSALQKGLRENDPRIRQAAELYVNRQYDEYRTLANKIISEKNFSKNNIVAAIQAEISKLTPSESEETAQKNKGLFTEETYVDALATGKTGTAATIRQDVISTYVSNGDSQDEAEKTFLSKTKTAIRNAYEDGDITQNKAVTLFVTYAGLDEDEAENEIYVIDFRRKHPELEDYDLSSSAITKYGTYGEPAGIDTESFFDAYEIMSSLSADVDENGKAIQNSKKKKVMSYIDSLPLTNSQKDALYLLNYAKSTIYQAPWR